MAGFDGLGLFPVEIDVYKKHKVSTINAHEDDANGRGLLVTLLKDGVPFNTTGIDLKLAFRNAIGEERLFAFNTVDLTNGKYSVTYPREMLEGNGGRVVRVEIKAYDTATQAMISYSPLNVYVSEAVVTEGQLVTNSEGSEFVKLLERVETAENAELLRVSAEGSRVSAESLRATAETDRVNAESSRVSAEQGRVTAEQTRASFYDGFNAQLADTVRVVNTNSYGTLSEAVTVLNVGQKKVFYIPEGDYVISGPLTINTNNIDIILASKARIIQTDQTKNTFVLNGDNIKISGGVIEYPEVWDGVNRKWEDYEAVILVKGDNIIVKEVTINNFYKVGIGLRGANNSVIRDNFIKGNFPLAQFNPTLTTHFGVAVDPSSLGSGEKIIITNNIIDSSVQGVFIGAYGPGFGYGIIVSDNVFTNCFDHGVYGNGGVGNIINGNSFKTCKFPIAVLGNNTLISNNVLYTDGQGADRDNVGISVREANGCVVSNNIIKGTVPNSSVCIDVTNLSLNPPPNTEVNDNIIEGNIIEITSGNCIPIRIGTSLQTIKTARNIVKNNIIKSNGVAGNALIVFASKAEGGGKYNVVEGNIITIINNTSAIQPYKQNTMAIKNNTIIFEYNAAAPEVITLINNVDVKDSIISGNTLKCESIYGANVNLRGYREDANSGYNLITDNLIHLDATLLSAKSEIFNQVTSVAKSNMLNRIYVP